MENYFCFRFRIQIKREFEIVIQISKPRSMYSYMIYIDWMYYVNVIVE